MGLEVGRNCFGTSLVFVVDRPEAFAMERQEHYLKIVERSKDDYLRTGVLGGLRFLVSRRLGVGFRLAY
jgi:hypothetical protein